MLGACKPAPVRAHLYSLYSGPHTGGLLWSDPGSAHGLRAVGSRVCVPGPALPRARLPARCGEVYTLPVLLNNPDPLHPHRHRHRQPGHREAE